MSNEQSKTTILRPSWKYFLLSYIYSILLIPVFGIGLISLYFVWQRHRQFRYEFSDTRIKASDGKYSQHFDLVNIESVEVIQSGLNKKMDVGTLLLNTETRQMKLFGLEQPGQYKQILEKAIQVEKQRQQKAEKTKPREPSHQPGVMEKKNYLTGLWQQGLISEEEFRREDPEHSDRDSASGEKGT